MKNSKPTSAVAEIDSASGQGKGKGKGATRTCLTVKEKRLKVDLWMLEGQQQLGSHFPIRAFTNNVGRRSAEAYVRRKERRSDRKG